MAADVETSELALIIYLWETSLDGSWGWKRKVIIGKGSLMHVVFLLPLSLKSLGLGLGLLPYREVKSPQNLCGDVFLCFRLNECS